jgi:hypothetical protein
MTAAQKAAKEKFSKAIAYRSKTGVSLKEAFAHVYGKKVGAVKKKAAPKKKTTVKKALIKKAAPKKVGYKEDRTTILKRGTEYIKKYKKKGYSRKDAVKNANLDAAFAVNGVKKAAPKKVTSSHKDTKSHNVNIRVVSGIVKAKPSVIILSKKIQKLTDSNLHNESVLALAKFLKEKKSIVLIQSVMKMMFSYGYMTNELTQIKRQILSELLKKFKSMYGEVDYKIIYDSF